MIKFFRRLFKKKNKITSECYTYIEKDTKCDKCSYADECILLEITRLNDERQHFIPAMGNTCKKR